MKSITKYILEYKGHAIRDKEKSIGDPDEIKHYFGMGYVHLKFNKDNAYPYVYNKNLNKIIIGKANTIHNNIFIPDNEKELKEMGLEDVKAIGQIRYCCGVDDDTEEIDKWYEENKKYVDSTVCGRIWYDAQDDFESWDSEEQAEQMAKIFGELKEFDSCKCYVANWNEIEPSEFQKVNDAIVELFAKKHNKKIKSYIVIDNNGEPKEMFVGENAKVEKRSASHKKEMEELMDIHNPKHGESWEEFRKRKREATKGYNKARDEHFQRDYYNQTKSKTAAEWHNNKTKRYNPLTGKMEWGEKIGDSLQMKTIKDYILEQYDNNILGNIEDEIRQDIKKEKLNLRVVGSCLAIFGEKGEDNAEVQRKTFEVIEKSKTYKDNKDDITYFYLQSKYSGKFITWFGSEEVLKKMAKNVEGEGEKITWKNK